MDDKLKRILEDAENAKATKDASEQSEANQRHSQMLQAGIALRNRLLPRLQEAKEQWAHKVELQINDQSDKFDISSEANRTYPTITVSMYNGAYVGSYIFRAYSGGGVHVLNGAGRNRGNSAYKFKVESLEDLTDEMIDEILTRLVRQAYGLEPNE